MKYKDLNAESYPKLLEDAIKKLTLTLERDSKVLTEMNNSLNWIVTLMAVVLATSINYFKNIPACGMEHVLLYWSRVGFCLIVVALVLHKVTLIKYESVKFQFLNTLNTHELELKYNIQLLRKNIDNDAIFSIADFINNFRNGEYVPYPALDSRKKEFLAMDKKIAKRASILKITFWVSLIIFISVFSSVFYLTLI